MAVLAPAPGAPACDSESAQLRRGQHRSSRVRVQSSHARACKAGAAVLCGTLDGGTLIAEEWQDRDENWPEEDACGAERTLPHTNEPFGLGLERTRAPSRKLGATAEACQDEALSTSSRAKLSSQRGFHGSLCNSFGEEARQTSVWH